ncbi:site-specific DNA-methyltransferase [Mariniblastus sp.]|nr:site-specific DNA-methyltransferase [Mariniblastus sp.]
MSKTTSRTTNKTKGKRWKSEALNTEETPDEIFRAQKIRRKAYFGDKSSLVINTDAKVAAGWLEKCGLKVDCIVTSPPFYGQRDYGVEGQLGLEDDPQEYIDKLVSTFNAFLPVLKETGSLWVNLGDTYWSGRGQHRSGESKQSARRFGLRPQDKRRAGSWTRPKQLLLIPHRFAIAMQDSDWIVRNDNVWLKPNPIPDQVRDRCSMSHEYVFHFTRQRFYYFLRENVGRPSRKGTMLPPLDTWQVPASRGGSGHKAAFSEELIKIPIQATCPPKGVVLDPFVGSGTTLSYAKKCGRRAVGIDLKDEFCELTTKLCKSVEFGTISYDSIPLIHDGKDAATKTGKKKKP